MREDDIKTVSDGDGWWQEDVRRCDGNRLGTTRHTGPLSSMWPSGDPVTFPWVWETSPSRDPSPDRTSRCQIPFSWLPHSKAGTHAPTLPQPVTPAPNFGRCRCWKKLGPPRTPFCRGGADFWGGGGNGRYLCGTRSVGDLGITLPAVEPPSSGLRPPGGSVRDQEPFLWRATSTARSVRTLALWVMV